MIGLRKIGTIIFQIIDLKLPVFAFEKIIQDQDLKDAV
uniref:Uncharacterized protein n=1 Tax=Anguilla anguilla TaxID=7936 RepID=A0A0E9XI84_ANGAN